MTRIITVILFLVAAVQTCFAQRFSLFAPEVKRDFPSVVYDFLERYLFEIDSLQKKGEYTDLKIKDDKVLFLTGTAATARRITPQTAFEVKKADRKFYQVTWTDERGKTLLDVAFPMQYELLLGKPKVEIEKEFKATLAEYNDYEPSAGSGCELTAADDDCLMTHPVAHYYLESLNNAVYYTAPQMGDTVTTFRDDDKWHSAANLFLGAVADVDGYLLYVEQNLYGFNKLTYTVPLRQWLAYCQMMKLNLYFAVEEEREDGLKALLIAQSQDLGFNHMLSVVIPDNFVTNPKAVLKATLNAYIPTQNVKDLYQKYVAKPKKRI